MGTNSDKFTLRDGVTLIAAFGLGPFVATHFIRTDTAGQFDNCGQPRIGWAVSCVLWSGVIAGPLILSVPRSRGVLV
jgi:hypothetical protein